MWKFFWSGTGHRWQYGTCALHAGYLRLNIYTLSLCNTHCFPTSTMVVRMRLSVILYLLVNCLSCTFCPFLCLYMENVYELRLLPYNTASETFLYKSGTVRSFDWIFVIGVPACLWLGECMTLGRTFYCLLFKQEAVAATVTARFFPLPHSSRRPLLEI
jgi:hypothetical protein